MNKTWQQYSDDPNSKVAKQHVVKSILKARNKKGIYDRIQFLAEQVKGKDVVDIGVVEHTTAANLESNWLHGHLAKNAKSITGVDVLPEGVEALQKRGYNVLLHNLIDHPLERKFEVAVCGDVLEHIDNPGKFLKNINESLLPDGKVLVTLPNPWYVAYPLKSALAWSHYEESADHVCWHDSNTLVELFGRHGFELESFRGVIVSKVSGWKAGLLKLAIPLILATGLIKHEFFSKTIVYEFKKLVAS